MQAALAKLAHHADAVKGNFLAERNSLAEQTKGNKITCSYERMA